MYLTDLVTLPRFCLGRNNYSRFPDLTRGTGRKFAVIGGDTALMKGMPRLNAAISGSDMELLGVFHFGGQCTIEAIKRMAEAIRPLGVDFIVGMGGGKAIDTAKGAAQHLGLPLVSLPTLVSNCAPITALSVVYREDGTFDRFLFYEAPPALTLIDLELGADAPSRYFRAGMGDAMAKYPEASFSAKADTLGEGHLDHMSALGLAVSSTCWEPILKFGRQALTEVEQHRAGTAMEMVARSIIVSAGLVSLMADDCYNCAVAHSVCYGLQVLPGIEENCLHGDLVAYGMLVQLMLDHQPEEAARLRTFLQDIGTPVSLAEMHLPLDRETLWPAVMETVAGPDMEHIPYPVTPEMIWEAMTQTEALS